jgi:hypothetical protein
LLRASPTASGGWFPPAALHPRSVPSLPRVSGCPCQGQPSRV